MWKQASLSVIMRIKDWVKWWENISTTTNNNNMLTHFCCSKAARHFVQPLHFLLIHFLQICYKKIILTLQNLQTVITNTTNGCCLFLHKIVQCRTPSFCTTEIFLHKQYMSDICELCCMLFRPALLFCVSSSHFVLCRWLNWQLSPSFH